MIVSYLARPPLPGGFAVSLSANPPNGATPLSTNLRANVSGTVPGTINYTVWWNCNDVGTVVGAVMAACGSIPTPSAGNCIDNANGKKCDAVNSNPLQVNHTYTTPGTCIAKVIAVS